VTLVLSELVSWMRTQSGTSSLRALLYMDEVFGFFPPVANPPSKTPMLTLLKQARAFGLGVVLATQNPVDLDYKGLSNAGTWFLGRLQTERDKMRVLDGLESATGSAGGFDRARVDEILSGLPGRVFLLHNVHEAEPVLFQTRWALSYLKGPLTRQEIRLLSEKQQTPASPAASRSAMAAAPEGGAPPQVEAGRSRPILPPDVPETFLVARGRGEEITYRPALLGLGRVHFVDAKKDLDHGEEVAFLLPLLEKGSGAAPDWREARELDRGAWDPDRELEAAPVAGATFADLPSDAAIARNYGGWEKDFADVLYRERRLELYESSLLGFVSRPGESERDFRIRLGDRARELRDEAMEKLRQRYASKLDAQQARVRRAEDRTEREQEQAAHQKRDTWLSVAETGLSVLFGRKTFSSTNVRRASSAIKRVSRTAKETGDVRRAEEELAEQREALKELTAELDAELAELAERHDPQNLEIGTVTIRPRRTDIEVGRVTLAWEPGR